MVQKAGSDGGAGMSGGGAKSNRRVDVSDARKLKSLEARTPA